MTAAAIARLHFPARVGQSIGTKHRDKASCINSRHTVSRQRAWRARRVWEHHTVTAIHVGFEGGTGRRQ